MADLLCGPRCLAAKPLHHSVLRTGALKLVHMRLRRRASGPAAFVSSEELAGARTRSRWRD
jgi:hypothetical protein